MKSIGIHICDASDLLDDLGNCLAGWRDAYLRAVVADLEGGEIVPDPMVLNDLAGMAILDGRHQDASKYLMAAAQMAETSSAKRVLVERAQEQARLAFEKRLAADLETLDRAAGWS